MLVLHQLRIVYGGFESRRPWFHAYAVTAGHLLPTAARFCLCWKGERPKKPVTSLGVCHWPPSRAIWSRMDGDSYGGLQTVERG